MPSIAIVYASESFAKCKDLALTKAPKNVSVARTGVVPWWVDSKETYFPINALAGHSVSWHGGEAGTRTVLRGAETNWTSKHHKAGVPKNHKAMRGMLGDV